MRSNFISPNGHQKQYFHEWRVKIQVLVFMNEIKFHLTLKKKIKFSVSFMLLFAIIKLLPTLRLSSGGSHE